MSTRDVNEPLKPIGSTGYWLSWMLGAAMLVAVVYGAIHVSEGRRFVAVTEGAKPWWLVLAVSLQGAAYLAQGEIFRGRHARIWLHVATDGSL